MDTSSSARRGFVAKPVNHDSARRVLLIVAISAFLAETAVMALIFVLPPFDELLVALLDSLLLVILIAPALYFFVLKPLRASIAQRLRAESVLAQCNHELATLHAIGSTACCLVETPQILSSVKDLLAGPAGSPDGTIFILDEASQELELELAWGGACGNLRWGARVPLESCPFRRVLLEKQAQVLTREQVESAGQGTGCLASSLPGSAAYVGIPLIARGQIQGLMVLANSSGERSADADHLSFWQAIGQIIGIAVHNNRLFAGEQKARQAAEVLRSAGVALTQSLDMRTVMEALLDSTARLVPYDLASIILVEDQDHLAIHAARGCGCAEQIKAVGRISVDRKENGLFEQVLGSRQGRILSDLSPETARMLSPCHASIRSWLGVPFVAGENVIGLFGVGKAQPGFYTVEHQQLAEALASQAAVAMQNAWLFAQLRTSRERLQTLSRQLVEVQENERGYIARELHDEAGQVLTSLMVGLRLLERDAQNPQAVVTGIAKLKTMVDNVLEELHRLARDLRPASLDYLGLEAALRQHLETVAEQNQITVQIDTVGIDLRFPKDIEVALYRIAQEAMANVARHAHASRVDVLLKKCADKLVMIIEDNGVGLNEETALSSGRLGLFGMRERAEMLGGSLTVECSKSGGASLLVEVPYGNSSADCR
ncbi:MAG: GAF domain-containing protein [Acidobacteriota bacterium]